MVKTVPCANVAVPVVLPEKQRRVTPKSKFRKDVTMKAQLLRDDRKGNPFTIRVTPSFF
jgi:hypothetical protein